MLTEPVKTNIWDDNVRENLLPCPFSDCDLHYSRFRFRMEQTQSIGPDVDHQCLVICLAFHTLDNSVATGMDQILSGTRDFTQCDFIDQQSAEISGRGYPVVVLMCDDGQQVVNADVYSRQLRQNQDCNTFRG